MNKKRLLILVSVLFILIGIFLWPNFKQLEVVTPIPITKQNTPTINAKFFCDNNKTIEATFNNGTSSSVDLILSDGRNLSLPQALSASGARYANTDESFVFWNKGDGAFIEENSTTTFDGCTTKPVAVETVATTTLIATTTNTLANPASVNCEKKGGKSVIQTKEDGSQYGLCYFDDARACEEWAMMRGECPIGGVKTTGYDTVAQKYCAWLGGKTVADADSICTFSDNSTCLDSDLYLDACKKGDWPKEK